MIYNQGHGPPDSFWKSITDKKKNISYSNIFMNDLTRFFDTIFNSHRTFIGECSLSAFCICSTYRFIL
jgi:hypothetical protein